MRGNIAHTIKRNGQHGQKEIFQCGVVHGRGGRALKPLQSHGRGRENRDKNNTRDIFGRGRGDNRSG